MYAPGSIYTPTNRPGRFPANLILTESVAQLLDDSALWVHSAGSEQPPQEKYARDVMPGITGCGGGGRPNGARIGDSGGPSRFFKLVRLGVS